MYLADWNEELFKITTITAVCYKKIQSINISDLWLGLGLESQGPSPRLHLYVHFAGQIDKKTPKHNTTWCSVSLP